jgi:nicotinamidase-related amidase
LLAIEGGAELKNSNTALFIIDMQNDFVLSSSPVCIAGAQGTVPSIVKVLNKFRERNFPIFHIIREHRKDGSDIESFRYQGFIEGQKYAVPHTKGCQIVKELKPKGDEYTIVKKRFSGFMGTELDFILNRLNISNIIITGTQYPNCVRATAFDAVALGYHVTIITDATSASTDEIARANIIDLENIDVYCIHSSELKF